MCIYFQSTGPGGDTIRKCHPIYTCWCDLDTLPLVWLINDKCGPHVWTYTLYNSSIRLAPDGVCQECNGLAQNRWLTHWGRVTHICVGKLSIIGSDNGLSPSRCQAIFWTNAGILLIRTLGTNFIKILIQIHTCSNTKMHLKMSSEKCRPFCLGLNVLTIRMALMFGPIRYTIQ